MYAPPLYVVRKFKFKEIIDNDFKMNFTKKEETPYLILQNDSQLLRQIRIITNKKGKYNPYVVFVDIKSAKANKEQLEQIIQKGFEINGIKYKMSERSASMTRNAILSFVDESIFEALHERIGMGLDIKRTVLSKYVAYRGLSLSSCHCIENWMPKIIIVKDFEQIIPNQNIKYVIDKNTSFFDKEGIEREWTQKDIVEGTEDITINTFDGMGIHHPAITEQAKILLDSKTEPTTIMWRLPFIKGVTHQMDYTVYFKEHGIKYITDIWGWKHNVDDIMIIMTESMYKGLKYFKIDGTHDDWVRYWDSFKKYNYCYGIAKWNFSIEEEPIYTRANYQILQDLDLSVDDFSKLYQYSTDWISNVIYGDNFYTYCFLGLRVDKTHALNEYVQSIVYNPQMIKEEGVRNYLISLFKKYINDMKCGKIYLKSTFKFACPDLVMFLEYLSNGEIEMNGCLQSDEFWTRGSFGTYSGEYAIERNPHLAQSEHAILKATTNNQIERWCSHLTNVAMLNSKSIIMQRLSGMD